MNYKVINIKGRLGYKDGLDLQMRVFDLVDNKKYDGVLLVLEHKPVLTMGIRTEESNLLVSKDYLQKQGVELYKTDRGGDITFHGPGQIVCYPILPYKNFVHKLSDYMHLLEKVVIDTLKQYNIDAYQKEEYPGVWVEDTKICAIGVRAKKFIVYHGLAFNINVNKDFFSLINPCGITNFNVSSMSDFLPNIDIEDVKKSIIESFNRLFGVKFEELSIDDLYA